MRCTVLANGQPIDVVLLTLTVPAPGRPSTVVASGPLEPLAGFATVIGALLPARAPLEAFGHTGRPSAPLWREPEAWPTLTLQLMGGALLQTRSVACMPLRGSPSGFHVRATLP